MDEVVLAFLNISKETFCIIKPLVDQKWLLSLKVLQLKAREEPPNEIINELLLEENFLDTLISSYLKK